MRGRPVAGAFASTDGGGRATQDAKAERFSPYRGRVDRHPVVRRSPRHPWRYDPLPAAMLSALTPVSPYRLHPCSRATQKGVKIKG